MATTDFSPQTAERSKDLTGRVALVTGGTRGIGAAICHSLAAAGAAVGAGFSSNRERADELREAVEADGGTLTLHQGNVGDWEDCQRVVHEVIDSTAAWTSSSTTRASPSTSPSGRCPSTTGTRCCASTCRAPST